MQQDEKQNVSRETLEGSVDMLDIARVAQDVEAREFAGMGSLKLVAPAKVNLYLNVKGVRDDGYHEVSTTMHALMLHDVLRMKIIPGTGEAVKLTTRSFEGLAPPGCRSAGQHRGEGYLEIGRGVWPHAGRRGTMRVHLESASPFRQAWAAARRMRQRRCWAAVLWGESVLDPRIKEVAAQLGADVVFFLAGRLRALRRHRRESGSHAQADERLPGAGEARRRRFHRRVIQEDRRRPPAYFCRGCASGGIGGVRYERPVAEQYGEGQRAAESGDPHRARNGCRSSRAFAMP